MGELRLDELGWAAIWTEATWFLNTKKTKTVLSCLANTSSSRRHPYLGSCHSRSRKLFLCVHSPFLSHHVYLRLSAKKSWHGLLTLLRHNEARLRESSHVLPSVFWQKNKNIWPTSLVTGWRRLILSVAFPLCLSLSGGFGWPRGQPQKNLLETNSACRKIARLSKFFTPGQRLTKTMAAKIAEGEDHVKKAEKYLKTSFMKWSPDYDSAGWCLPKFYRLVDIIGFFLTTNHLIYACFHHFYGSGWCWSLPVHACQKAQDFGFFCSKKFWK